MNAAPWTDDPALGYQIHEEPLPAYNYEQLPDDLNADLQLPEREEYLDYRFDEEIVRLRKKK